MHIISQPLSEALNVLFKLEKDNFDTLKGGVLALYMGEYLETERDDAIGINPDVLGLIDTSQMSEILRDMQLYYAKSAYFTKVSNGSEELGSILTFITNNGLYSRYLEDSDRQNFISWFLDGKGDILKPESYRDPQNARLAQNMIHLLDKVLTEIIGGNFRALGQSLTKSQPEKLKMPITRMKFAKWFGKRLERLWKTMKFSVTSTSVVVPLQLT